ncbi:D-isomer specific 2-hydroxyacid dehydrogenase family protein [Candidatus Solirubrobacter pratensis]|uniref:D-isomer specific 2-hydroxyacid dehydrogenase family protein n=1 Tax=Candidatus Solirubrobacter pratensis TaxID=1298857 RepID=UPI0003FE0807|nr:D-isomer specific 2-hydroxyacid dehydrogenase family protein [Candidatus Solirubrobacter pratensis]
MSPSIHVGPGEQPELAHAVETAGGTVVSLAQADGVVWAGTKPDSLPELPRSVRWVQLPSAGVEPWMSRIAATPNVTFTSAAGAYAPQVAEHALALLLAGLRGIAASARERAWRIPPHRTLSGATVAIVGAGGIGRALIEQLAPFNVEVIAVTRRGHDVPGAARTLAADAIGDVWAQADHFVIAAPATGATRHLVGAHELAAMREHSWIVNIARGSLIDTDALVDALRERRIGGAALDVTDPEPLPDGHPLWTLPNALITPHIANPEAALTRQLARRVRENVERLASGEALIAQVDAERGY